ncbi:TIGR03750 family conjugative transfer region protein [Klebsiella pneumoniae UCI 37]|nr:TIGR03750 family conjugative transfer region protein [Klebsiella pneumoniae UCI 37]
MATIQFMPDRLNAEPVVFRGFTTPELGLTALFSTLAGIVISLPFLFFSWVMIPRLPSFCRYW